MCIRDSRAHSLFELTRDLSAALQSEQVVELGETVVQRTFGGEAHVLLMGMNDQLLMTEPLPENLDASIADWTFHHGQHAGLGTTTLPSNPWHYVPLKAPMRTRGVLALRPAQPRWLLIPEQMQQLETLARQIAIALERVHYVEAVSYTHLDVYKRQFHWRACGGIVSFPTTSPSVRAASGRRATAGATCSSSKSGKFNRAPASR